MSASLSVSPHVSARPPLDGLPRNLILEIFITNCRRTPNLITVGQKYRESYMKTSVRFIVAGNINSPQEHLCSTINIFILLRVKCRSTIHTEHIVKFPLQQ